MRAIFGGLSSRKSRSEMTTSTDEKERREHQQVVTTVRAVADVLEERQHQLEERLQALDDRDALHRGH